VHLQIPYQRLRLERLAAGDGSDLHPRKEIVPDGQRTRNDWWGFNPSADDFLKIWPDARQFSERPPFLI
jgi:hypothetical protein